jgi:ParB family chromosome partitioning protein
MPATSVAFRSKGQRLLIEVSDKKERGFINFVATQLERLYKEWKEKS